MLLPIITHTPLPVWVLLALLLALGWSQSRPGHVALARTMLMPLALAGLSLVGAASAFGATPLVLASWCAAALPVAWAVARTAPPAGTRYDAAQRRFAVGGSWVPLALMLGIFALRYTVTVTLLVAPARAHAPSFALVATLLYGVFSGSFFGRSARLLRLAYRTAAPKPRAGLAA